MDKYRPYPSMISMFTSDSQHPPRSRHAVHLGEAAILDSPRLAKAGAGLSKYDNGTNAKHLHKTNIFDGRNSIVLTVKPCLP